MTQCKTKCYSYPSAWMSEHDNYAGGPLAFIFPGLDLPLSALMRTVVTYKSFLWRGQVEVCHLSKDHQGSNSKAKSASGELEFTRKGNDVFDSVLTKGKESDCFLIPFQLFSQDIMKLNIQKWNWWLLYVTGFKYRTCDFISHLPIFSTSPTATFDFKKL